MTTSLLKKQSFPLQITLILCFITVFCVPLFAQKNRFEVYIKKGDACFKIKDYKEAAKYFGKAIKENNRQVSAWQKRANALKRLKKYKDALKDYTEVIRLEPNNGQHYNDRAECWLGLKKNEGACTDLEKAFQLGVKSAKPLSKKLGCAWYKALANAPCPVKNNIITDISVEAFTGAVVISKGIAYEKMIFSPKGSAGFWASAELGAEQEVLIRVSKPQNFCLDPDDNITLGCALRILGPGQKEVSNQKDIYHKTSFSLMPADSLKSLVVSIRSNLFPQKNVIYTVELRFYDKRGRGELLITLPMCISEQSPLAKNAITTHNALGMGVHSSAIGIEVRSLLLQDSKKQVVRWLAPEQAHCSLQFVGFVTPKSKTTTIIRWVDAFGQIVKEEKGFLDTKSTDSLFEFSTKGLKKGVYTTWIKLKEQNSERTFGAVLPIEIK
ncbi:MAG: tetratricopeptide repeat protein [Cytophagales bacterium]|nr:MAG: tetratricopeptide repeat protein [Cytophagales bacterium]TAF59709.1 MAG: tetratricopeptide repeat protein [Cytophagales bacterium]